MTPTTTFETFPFPRPTGEQMSAITEAARRLNELRGGWLNPEGASPEALEASRVAEVAQAVLAPGRGHGLALVVNARLKGQGLWLYVYALPLGISELAAGIVWVSIFTQSGWLNSILINLGITDRAITWQSAETPVIAARD